MLSHKSKFDQKKSNQLSVILKRTPQVHVNLIQDQPMKDSFLLSEVVMSCCEFTVQESGYYHVSSQVTLKNVSDQPVNVEYVQFGVCKKSMEDYQNLLKSSIMNSNCGPEYVIADNLTSIVQLNKDEQYQLWVNFGCEQANKFEFQSKVSNLRLYKL